MRMAGQAGLLRLVGLHLNLVAGRQEGVEAQHQLREAVKQRLDLVNHAGGVDSARQAGWSGRARKKTLGAGGGPQAPATAPRPDVATHRA